ncbi:MAG: EpsD family peptidyl-prolyl cis-trans isomerase [Burkholderiales bacterium]|nr:EpsD family peptidyl-prolyl cis-trans isomerase [Burkholderiales bacterium]
MTHCSHAISYPSGGTFRRGTDGAPGKSRGAGVTVALALALALGACGSDDKPKPPGQAVAQVNGTEITIHEVNNELARMGVQGGADNQQAAKRVLDMLIDQQLLAQQAAASKLDRDPQVMQALEQARRRMLSEAWLERNVNAARPTAEEVNRFYTENPALFQKRRVYSFRDFVIERSKFSDALRVRLDSVKTPADLAATLKGMNVNYRETANMRGAEQLPLEMLPRVAAMAKGDISVLVNENAAILMQLVDSTEQPVALAQATPLIEQYLLNTRKRQAAESKVKELRAGAKIAYLGAFAPEAAGQKPQTQPALAAPAGDASRQGAGASDESLRKGLQGVIRK